MKIFLSRQWRKMLLAGVSFWLPDLIYHYLHKAELTPTAILVLTLLMPITTAIFYIAVAFMSRKQGEMQAAAISMLLGIWLLAPVMITLGATFAGAGFRTGPLSFLTVFLGTLVFPVYALIMSGMDLTIPALLVVTVLLAAIHFLWEKRMVKAQVRHIAA